MRPKDSIEMSRRHHQEELAARDWGNRSFTHGLTRFSATRERSY